MQTKHKVACFSANILNCIYEKEKCNFFVDMELSVLNCQSVIKVAMSNMILYVCSSLMNDCCSCLSPKFGEQSARLTLCIE